MLRSITSLPNFCMCIAKSMRRSLPGFQKSLAKTLSMHLYVCLIKQICFLLLLICRHVCGRRVRVEMAQSSKDKSRSSRGSRYSGGGRRDRRSSGGRYGRSRQEILINAMVVLYSVSIQECHKGLSCLFAVLFQTFLYKFCFKK